MPQRALSSTEWGRIRAWIQHEAEAASRMTDGVLLHEARFHAGGGRRHGGLDHESLRTIRKMIADELARKPPAQ